MTILPKGTILNGPDGQAYELAENVSGSLGSRQVKAIGGAPEAVTGTVMPQWVIDALDAARKRAEASE